MKFKIVICGLLLSALMSLSACRSMLIDKPAPNSVPVSLGLVDTNSPNLVAYLQAASHLNQQYDPTPYRPAITGLLDGLTMLASAFCGWYARHATARETTAAVLAATGKAASEIAAAKQV